MTRTTRCGAARRGLTLIELIVTLAILSMLMLVAVPALDGAAPGARLRAGARTGGATVRWLRSEAVTRGEPMALTYDLAGNRLIALPGGQAEDDPDDEARRAFLPRALPKDVRIAAIEVEGQTGGRRTEVTVRFDPRGRVAAHALVLAMEGRTPLRVSVHPLTGAVRIEEDEETRIR